MHYQVHHDQGHQTLFAEKEETKHEKRTLTDLLSLQNIQFSIRNTDIGNLPVIWTSD